MTLRGYDLGVLVTRVALEGLLTDNIAPSSISHCLLAFSVPLASCFSNNFHGTFPKLSKTLRTKIGIEGKKSNLQIQMHCCISQQSNLYHFIADAFEIAFR